MSIVLIFAAIYIATMTPVLLMGISVRLNITGFPYILNAMFSYDFRKIAFPDNNPRSAVERRRIPVIVIIDVVEIVVVDYVVGSSYRN